MSETARRRLPVGKTLLYVALVVGGLIMLFPFIWTVVTSITPGATFTSTPKLIPDGNRGDRRFTFNVFDATLFTCFNDFHQLIQYHMLIIVVFQIKGNQLILCSIFLDLILIPELLECFVVYVRQSHPENIFLELFAHIEHFSIQHFLCMIDQCYIIAHFFYTFHSVCREDNCGAVIF